VGPPRHAGRRSAGLTLALATRARKGLRTRRRKKK
jgi:hypothetical protein